MNNNRWIWLLVIFILAGSITSTFGFILSLFFGFGADFSYCATLPLMAIVFWLFYKEYTVYAWVVVGCAVWVVVSILILIGAFLRTEPDIPATVQAYFTERGVIGADEYALFSDFVNTEDDYWDSLSEGDDLLESGETHDIIFNSTGYYGDNGRRPLTIMFPKMSAPGGEWAFVEGNLKVTGAINATFTATTEDNWSNLAEMEFTATDQTPVQQIEPYMNVDIPQFPLDDQEIEVVATLTIATAGSDLATPNEQTLTRTATLLVVSDKYYSYRQEYAAWQRSRRVVETGWGVVLVASTIVAGAVGIVFYRRGAFSDYSSGSLRFEMRRTSGLQQLGIEAFTLSKLDPAITYGVTEGVYVGRVEAQSPAGRSGLRSADIVQTVNGKEVNSPNQLNKAISGHKRGDMVQMRVLRNGEQVDLVIKF